jgi:hypothetical protein
MKDRYSKKEACSILSIAPRTLNKRMKSGEINFTREPCTSKFKGSGRVWFTAKQLGIVTAPAHDVRVQPQYEDDAKDSTTTTTRTFAERFLTNEVPDSLGNFSDGSNPRWPNKGVQTLLGPQEPMERMRADTTGHMVSPVGGGERVENPVDSDAFLELLHPGSADRKAAMYAECGLRPLSQQQQKERNDKLALHAAFGWAR